MNDLYPTYGEPEVDYHWFLTEPMITIESGQVVRLEELEEREE